MDTTAAEARYRTLFEHSSDGIMIAEIETQAIRHANPAACRMFGYSEEALCSMHVAELIPKETLERSLEEFESLARGTTTRVRGRAGLRADGTIIFVDINAAPVTIGDRAMVAGFFRDVTEAQRAEDALRTSEEKYRRLFEAARDGILVLDAETGHVIDANPFMTTLTGFSREELLDEFLWDIGPLKDTGASRASFAQLQAQGSIVYDSLPLRTREGGTVDVEFVSNVYALGDRKVIQCNIRDVSSRKRDEGARLRLVRAIEQADEMILMTDLRGNIEYVNPAFERITGYSRLEARGKNPRFLKSHAQDDAFYRELWATLGSGTTWRGRLVNRRKDGTIFTQESTISRLVDSDGRVTGYVGVSRDVTAVLTLEAQYLQAQKMEAVGRLAGGVSHDFNNVLSVILSYSELISGELRSDDPLRADVEEIQRAARRAAGLTKQLLAFSRRQVLETKVLNVNDTVVGLEKMIARLVSADVTLTTVPATDLWNVKADPAQVEQILMNLAVNARDAMPKGGRLTIETANVELDEDYARVHQGARAGEYVLIAVSDTGTGMDKETQAHIFEPFFTTKEKGRGTGLGLATVFGIVQQSGGHVWVYSEPGQGTTFKVYLPRFGGVAERPSMAPTAPGPARGDETILLVEDEDEVRVLARNILRRHGYVVLDAPNGGEALLICEQHGAKIDLLLTDVVLPRMSGRQLSDRLASLRPEMKVLFMSGYTDDAILLHGILDSGVAFLQKPLTPTSLTRRIREVLDSPRRRAG
jgi:PAS domain S-box-containing protein